MASFNKVILMGNLTHDPELRQTQSGLSVCSFSIAVNRYAKDNGDTVDYIDIVTWRQQAEFVSRYFKKGNSILVCGQLQTREYTDKNGNKRRAVEVVADEVTFTASKAENSPATAHNGDDGANTPTTYTPAAYGGNSAQFEELPAGDEPLPF